MLPLLVTAAILRDAGKVLITRRPEGRPYAGMWEFPGGKMDGGETPQDCLRREIVEELDLRIEVGSIFEVAYYRYEWGPVLILAYECRPLSECIRNVEVAEHRWVFPSDLEEYTLLPADRPIIDKLLLGNG